MPHHSRMSLEPSMVPVVPGELAHKTCRFQKEQQKLQTPRGEDPATTAPKEAGSEPGAGAAASEGGGRIVLDSSPKFGTVSLYV